ncbi:MAG: polyprenyl synthetase family protein, partial [Cellulomonadaceae bacterium]|nr:polyprenyl synthetase family protein [Cellulomonadaceae bacterium]
MGVLLDAKHEARYAALIAAVESELQTATQYADPAVQVMVRHLLTAGGKRLRPLLVLLAAGFGDPNRPEVISAAVAVELTHLATLYHDDVMDAAPIRRGEPSAHALWGNHAAILTGDLLFARASKIVAGLGPQAVKIQAETFERLCLGELHEALGPGVGADPVEFYLQILRDKTASLTAAAAQLGAFLAGAPSAAVSALTAYGELLGVAFQLADDVLDLTGGAAVTGKEPGIDLRDGVATMPVLLLRQRVSGGAGTDVERRVVAALDGHLSDEATLA